MCKESTASRLPKTGKMWTIEKIQFFLLKKIQIDVFLHCVRVFSILSVKMTALVSSPKAYGTYLSRIYCPMHYL